jgi:hypothetical protein
MTRERNPDAAGSEPPAGAQQPPLPTRELRIVERHDGRIRLEAAPEHGTRVFLRLDEAGAPR